MTLENRPGSGPSAGALVEQGKRFSESILWTLMRRYYAGKGPSAWHSGEVPSYATCNTYITRSYAEVVLAYLRDAEAARMIDPAHPVYIVELAAGVGRFAYQFLSKFQQLKRDSSLRDLDVRYVMTDFATTNVEVWSRHPHLSGFVEDHHLTFGRFDVETDDAVHLIDGSLLSAATVKNPIVVLANYAFDTFTHDLFRVKDGVLHEVQISTRAPDATSDVSDPAILPRLQVQYSDQPIGPGYYADPVLQRVLEYYQAHLAETAFTIPLGGMRALRALTAISGQRLFLVSSDKGFTHEEELYHPLPQSMQFHGSFSMMVNYHAIGQYFRLQGGHCTATTRKSLTLRTVACLLGGEGAQFANTVSMFRERIDNFGPGEWFEMLQQRRQEKVPVTIPSFLFLLRESGWDPTIVWDHAAQLRELGPQAPESLQIELVIAMERAWQNYFPGPQNLPFELARIYMAMRRPREAIHYAKIGIEWFGEIPAALLNLGICHYYAENPEEALRCFQRSLALNPNFGQAREWTARVRAEQAQRAPSRVVRAVDASAMVSARMGAAIADQGAIPTDIDGDATGA